MTADPFAGLPGALRRLLEAREMTQTELARRTALAQPQISDYLRGRREPGLRTLARLLIGLDATVADLGNALGAEQQVLPPLSDLVRTIARLERELERVESNGR